MMFTVCLCKSKSWQGLHITFGLFCLLRCPSFRAAYSVYALGRERWVCEHLCSRSALDIDQGRVNTKAPYPLYSLCVRGSWSFPLEFRSREDFSFLQTRTATWVIHACFLPWFLGNAVQNQCSGIIPPLDWVFHIPASFYYILMHFLWRWASPSTGCVPGTVIDAGDAHVRQNMTRFWPSKGSQSCSRYPKANGLKTSMWVL